MEGKRIGNLPKEFALGESLLALFPFLLFFVRLQRFTVELNQLGEAVAVDEKDAFVLKEADFTRPLEPRTFSTDFSAMV